MRKVGKDRKEQCLNQNIKILTQIATTVTFISSSSKMFLSQDGNARQTPCVPNKEVLFAMYPQILRKNTKADKMECECSNDSINERL